MKEISRKPVDELEFTDDFMFSTIMQNPEICKGVLERLLKMKISRVEYPAVQKSISPFYDARGIRLDVYCESNGKTYDIEMQNGHYSNLSKRTRYYQSMLDSEQLNRGVDYENLKESFIIFICKDDPFKFGVPLYFVEQTFKNVTDKNGNPVEFTDGVQKFFFNAAAYEKESDSYLRSFLKFVHTSRPDDDFTELLDARVRENKKRESFRSTYMEWILFYHDARRDGLEEGEKIGLAKGESKAKLEDAVIAVTKYNVPVENVAKDFGIPLETLTEALTEKK